MNVNKEYYIRQAPVRDLLALLHRFEGFHLEVGVDEAVDVAVHDRVDVAHLVAGTGVLREGVRHENVGTDLGTPGDLQLVALDVLDLVEVLTLFDLDELGLQHAHTDFAVLVLGPFDLAADHDARRLVDETDGGGRLVDLLAARLRTAAVCLILRMRSSSWSMPVQLKRKMSKHCSQKNYRIIWCLISVSAGITYRLTTTGRLTGSH